MLFRYIKNAYNPLTLQKFFKRMHTNLFKRTTKLILNNWKLKLYIWLLMVLDLLVTIQTSITQKYAMINENITLNYILH